MMNFMVMPIIGAITRSRVRAGTHAEGWTAGYFKLTQAIDPLGRTTSFIYSNHIDLAAISQTTAYGDQTTIAQFIYNTRHRPILSTDAAGQTTSYTYNTAGQVTSITNPLGQKRSYQYNASNDITSITNANNATAATYAYDDYGRIRNFTDSEGWTVTYDYDAATGKRRSLILMERRTFTPMTSLISLHSRTAAAGYGPTRTTPIGD
jgi:YD repeat-containing protein